MPDFEGQEPPTYHYCRLKITVIPRDKNKPISEELDAYISVYLQEEIRAEGLIRKLPVFTRFLRV